MAEIKKTHKWTSHYEMSKSSFKKNLMIGSTEH